ncbi:hypothetical protein [Psychroserpens damuponensis]|uniref:hypothetical protein n=1 Tax=Psychroserpens damuponensis TaxID=943936 RepID=UPI00058B5A65|nr:hypothetical protein [Psychroserpens damuponensis]
MKHLFLLATLIVGTLTVTAQDAVPDCVAAGCYDQVGVGQSYDYNNFFSESRAISFPVTQANKKIIDDFQTASINVNGKSTVYSARYNPISNEIEIKGDNDDVYNIKRLKDVKISFNGTNQFYKAVVYKDAFGQDMIDYFNILNTSDILLKRISYSYVKAKEAKSSYDKAKPAYYKEKINYYYVDNSERLIKLSTKRKDIKKRYEKSATEILAYIKTHKIDDSQELDLLKFATYLKRLKSENSLKNRLVENK